MFVSLQKALALLGLGVLMAGCSASPPPAQIATSSPPPVMETAFVTTVEVAHYGDACDKDPRCWLPTQFGPMLVQGQSVSTKEEWPVKGDSIDVLCRVQGEKLRNGILEESDTWYGILVPTERSALKDPGLRNAFAKPVQGGVIGYVNDLAVKDKNMPAPACP